MANMWAPIKGGTGDCVNCGSAIGGTGGGTGLTPSPLFFNPAAMPTPPPLAQAHIQARQQQHQVQQQQQVQQQTNSASGNNNNSWQQGSSTVAEGATRMQQSMNRMNILTPSQGLPAQLAAAANTATSSAPLPFPFAFGQAGQSSQPTPPGNAAGAGQNINSFAQMFSKLGGMGTPNVTGPASAQFNASLNAMVPTIEQLNNVSARINNTVQDVFPQLAKSFDSIVQGGIKDMPEVLHNLTQGSSVDPAPLSVTDVYDSPMLLGARTVEQGLDANGLLEVVAESRVNVVDLLARASSTSNSVARSLLSSSALSSTPSTAGASLGNQKPMKTAWRCAVPQKSRTAATNVLEGLWLVGDACEPSAQNNHKLLASVAVTFVQPPRSTAPFQLPTDAKMFRSGTVSVTTDVLKSPGSARAAKLSADGRMLLVLASVFTSNTQQNEPVAVLLALDTTAPTLGAPFSMLPNQTLLDTKGSPFAKGAFTAETLGAISPNAQTDVTGVSRAWLNFDETVEPCADGLAIVPGTDFVLVLLHAAKRDGARPRPLLAVLRVPSYPTLQTKFSLEQGGNASEQATQNFARDIQWQVVNVYDLSSSPFISKLAQGRLVSARRLQVFMDETLGWQVSVQGETTVLSSTGSSLVSKTVPWAIEICLSPSGQLADPLDFSIWQKKVAERALSPYANMALRTCTYYHCMPSCPTSESITANSKAGTALKTNALSKSSSQACRVFVVEADRQSSWLTKSDGLDVKDAKQETPFSTLHFVLVDQAGNISVPLLAAVDNSGIGDGPVLHRSVAFDATHQKVCVVGSLERVPGVIASRVPWISRFSIVPSSSVSSSSSSSSSSASSASLPIRPISAAMSPCAFTISNFRAASFATNSRSQSRLSHVVLASDQRGATFVAVGVDQTEPSSAGERGLAVAMAV